MGLTDFGDVEPADGVMDIGLVLQFPLYPPFGCYESRTAVREIAVAASRAIDIRVRKPLTAVVSTGKAQRMFCPKCGSDNTDTAVQCIRCSAAMPRIEREYGLGNSALTSPRVVVGNNLVWAILSTLFCCLPTGIVAIVYAAQVDGKVSAGDIAGAQVSARNAATWSWVSFGLGAVFVVGYIALVVVGATLGHR